MTKQTILPKNMTPAMRRFAAACCSFLLLFSLLFSGCGRQASETPSGSAISHASALTSSIASVPLSHLLTASLSLPALADATTLTDFPCAELSPETEDIFCQILLLLQDGFRRYQVHGTYQVYFSAPERAYTDDDGNTVMGCSLLLKDIDAVGTDFIYWEENLNFVFDSESDRYTFTWYYEPVMTQDDSLAISANFSWAEEVLENCIYETTLSPDTIIDAQVKYDAVPCPVISDNFFTTSPYFPLHTMSYLYTYQDERMGVYITVSYPALYVSDSDLTKTLNARIRDAFFYGYDWEKEPNPLIPEEMILTSIDRSYFITREDAQYFSVRIYEYNEVRRAAHPNEWETGLTLSMETGKVITLRDIAGDAYTPAQLLDSGAFHINWGDLARYLDEEGIVRTEKEWMETIRENYQDSTLEDFDTDFYLTDDSLGLIVTTFGDEYVCIEAKLSDLGLEEWSNPNPADR